MDGEVETVAVAGDVVWEEIKSREDKVDWGADRKGEIVDYEMRGGEEKRWGIGDEVGDFEC